MKRISAATLFCLSFLAAGLPAQQPLDGRDRLFQDSLLDRLAGAWSMSGAVRGRPTTLTLTGDWVLTHQFLKLEMRDVNDPPAYQAAVYVGYDHASERYVAHWLDVFGGRFSETLGYGQRAGNSVAFVFEYPDGPFHTTFTLEPRTGTWTVLMQDRGPTGGWREFAHYVVQRR
jgi:hypothetical protein